MRTYRISGSNFSSFDLTDVPEDATVDEAREKIAELLDQQGIQSHGRVQAVSLPQVANFSWQSESSDQEEDGSIILGNLLASYYQQTQEGVQQ